MPQESTVEILDRLIGFPSVFTADDYSAITDFAETHLRACGFSVHRLGGATPGRAGLFASLGPAGRGGVLLSAHLDVVPADAADWTSDPFRMVRRGGRLHGRGSTDMKGFAAAMLAVASRATRRPLQAPLKLALSYDEEAGCVGMAEMIGALDETIGTPAMCIVGEPTSMQVAIGHKGKQSYRMRFRGTAGHSSVAPAHVNALHLAADAIGILRRLQDDLAQNGRRDEAYDIPYTTVHVGTLQGGSALNVVPDHAELEFEIRTLAGDDADWLVARLRAAMDACIAERHRPAGEAGATIELVNSYPGLATPADAEVVRAAFRLGGRAPVTKVSYGTEAGFFSEAWAIPTVVCGPGDMAQGHKPDEFIEEAQLAACDAMLDNVLDFLCR